MKTLNLLLSNFVSYSQDFEDFILFYIFHDIQKWLYIECWANDPNFFSVTKAFYERGWHGINIEPLPHKYKLLQNQRPKDINLQTGVWNIESKANLSVYGFMSSLFYNKKNINNFNIININLTTMSNICRKHIRKGIRIQFCKINVERSEKYVLLGFDFINYRPKIFCIESLINRKDNIPEYKEWEFILTKNDYSLGYVYGRNRFYYDNRINGLKEKFYNIDYYVKKFRK